MSESSRFASPTSGFELSELHGRLRGMLWASFGLGALLHLALVAIDPFRHQAAKAPRPLTTKFIKREPRLTKPLELRKIPQPRRQMVRRKVGLAPARMDRVRANRGRYPSRSWRARERPKTRSTWLSRCWISIPWTRDAIAPWSSRTPTILRG